MIAPVQKLLPIRAELRLPTVDLAGARGLLDLREDEIKDLVDEKVIPAWNIARTNDTRRELRILTRAARDYAQHGRCTVDDDHIIRLLHGPDRPFIWGRDWYRAWNCDSGHMINLLRDGVLISHNDHWSRGRNGTPAITWKSAVAFLKSRRIK